MTAYNDGNWPPVEPTEHELRALMRASQRRSLAGSSPAHVPLVEERSRTWWQALLCIGEPRWWLDLEEGDQAERWPATFTHHSNGWPCRYGYLLDGTFTVMTEVGCRTCGKRLDWPNFYVGKRIACRNWQAYLVHGAIALAGAPRRAWRRIRSRARAAWR